MEAAIHPQWLINRTIVKFARLGIEWRIRDVKLPRV